MLGLYVLGIIAAAGTAWVFKTLAPQGPRAGVHPRDADLQGPAGRAGRPPGRGPTRASFIAKAGTIIFCLSVILWAMMYYPRLPESRVDADSSSKLHAAQTAGELSERRTSC